MTANKSSEQPHKSAVLGAKSMLLGLVGMVIAYFGLWIKSEVTGLIGWSMVAVAALGGVISLLWYISANIRNRLKQNQPQGR